MNIITISYTTNYPVIHWKRAQLLSTAGELGNDNEEESGTPKQDRFKGKFLEVELLPWLDGG